MKIEDLEVGKTYSYDQLDQSVIDILEIDVNDHSRSIYYKILHYAQTSGGCTAIEIAYPSPSSYTQDIDASWLLWQKNSGWNGTYTYTWTGSGCGDTDKLYLKRYTTGSGGLNVVSDNQYGPTSGPGISGDIVFSDGGWQIGGMTMN